MKEEKSENKNQKIFIISVTIVQRWNYACSSLYTCSKCKREFNFDNIKYDDDKSLICIECLNKKQKIHRKDLIMEKPEEAAKVNFICLSCRFKFSIRKDSSKSVKCPFCAKTKLMVVKKYKDENDLINDSMDPRFGH